MSAQPKTFQELINGETLVLVDFFATWCGPCKMMQPILEDTARQVGDRLKIVKVDVDRNPLAASTFQVRGVPTLVLFQKGKILWRESGVVPAHHLVKVIESHLGVNA
ncbi:thioredoxin [Algoriphagus limi]|uniref:Thioredoxin n=1 Tax=Algoriphagus limi TaxID=2975273 RepID=A0ABT2G960_9BACT|nr:thioredoxin [Algoriphagus limi]MCS5491820.1 thioredoxin [Algoriphagus limi]